MRMSGERSRRAWATPVTALVAHRLNALSLELLEQREVAPAARKRESHLDAGRLQSARNRAGDGRCSLDVVGRRGAR
jgi:hypothetical protein